MRTVNNPKTKKRTMHIPEAIVNRIEAICAHHNLSIQNFIIGSVISAIINLENNIKGKPTKEKTVKKTATRKAATKKVVRKKVAAKKAPAKKKSPVKKKAK